jgi:hypothetical protein
VKLPGEGWVMNKWNNWEKCAKIVLKLAKNREIFPNSFKVVSVGKKFPAIRGKGGPNVVHNSWILPLSVIRYI